MNTRKENIHTKPNLVSIGLPFFSEMDQPHTRSDTFLTYMWHLVRVYFLCFCFSEPTLMFSRWIFAIKDGERAEFSISQLSPVSQTTSTMKVNGPGIFTWIWLAVCFSWIWFLAPFLAKTILFSIQSKCVRTNFYPWILVHTNDKSKKRKNEFEFEFGARCIFCYIGIIIEYFYL